MYQCFEDTDVNVKYISVVNVKCIGETSEGSDRGGYIRVSGGTRRSSSSVGSYLPLPLPLLNGPGMPRVPYRTGGRAGD